MKKPLGFILSTFLVIGCGAPPEPEDARNLAQENDDVQLQSNFQDNRDNTAYLTCRGKSARRRAHEQRRIQLFVQCEMLDGRVVGSNSISAEWGLNNEGEMLAFSSEYPRPIGDCALTLQGGFGTPIIFTALCEDINGAFRINTFELQGTNINGLIINNRLVMN